MNTQSIDSFLLVLIKYDHESNIESAVIVKTNQEIITSGKQV